MRVWLYGICWLLFSQSVLALTEEAQWVITEKPFAKHFTYYGKVVPYKKVAILSPYQATLKHQYVEYGDIVNKNTLIAELTSPDLLLAYQQAELDLAQQRKEWELLNNWEHSPQVISAQQEESFHQENYEQKKSHFLATKKLYAKGIVAKSECLLDKRNVEQAFRQWQNAKENTKLILNKNNHLELAKLKLALNAATQKAKLLKQKVENLKIYAPITGRLINPRMLQLDLDQNVASFSDPILPESSIIALLAPQDTVWVKAQVNEFDLSHLSKALSAKVYLPAFEQAFEASVESIQDDAAQLGNKQSRYQLLLSIKLPASNVNIPVRFGMSAEITITQPVVDKSIMVPATAVYFQNGLPYVYKKHDKTDDYLPQLILIGHKQPNYIQVVEGLSVGDTIVKNHSAYQS